MNNIFKDKLGVWQSSISERIMNMTKQEIYAEAFSRGYDCGVNDCESKNPIISSFKFAPFKCVCLKNKEFNNTSPKLNGICGRCGGAL